MKIYIAGPITGIDDYRRIFKAAETKLQKQGHIVWNPAYAPTGLEYEQYFPVCFAMIDTCDALYMLPGWEKSTGAKREYDYAKEKGLTIYIAGDKLPKSKNSTEILFDTFWQAYPKKIAKPKALLAWNKLKPTQELLDKILSALQSQKQSENWIKDGGQFIPYPATYLNQYRWEDVVDEQIKPQDSSFNLSDVEMRALQKYKK